MVVVVMVVTDAVAGFNSRYTNFIFFKVELIVILQVAVIM